MLSFVSDFPADKLLLKRRLAGRDWIFATIRPVTGSAGLTAPEGI
jgi:hypothetical protein